MRLLPQILCRTAAAKSLHKIRRDEYERRVIYNFPQKKSREIRPSTNFFLFRTKRKRVTNFIHQQLETLDVGLEEMNAHWRRNKKIGSVYYRISFE